MIVFNHYSLYDFYDLDKNRHDHNKKLFIEEKLTTAPGISIEPHSVNALLMFAIAFIKLEL
jgi:hypothetical protein